MDNIAYILIFAMCVFFSSCAQILLKRGAGMGYSGLRVYLNVYVVIGYSVFLLVTFATVTLYRFMHLSTGALLESLAYVFIPALSAVVLKEKIGKRLLAGSALIICGIMVYAVWGGV